MQEHLFEFDVGIGCLVDRETRMPLTSACNVGRRAGVETTVRIA